MKNANTVRKGVFGLAMAGLAGATFLTGASNALVFDKDRDDNVTVTRTVDDFTKIRIKGAIELDVQGGKDFSITIEGEQRHIDDLETFVRRGTLIIDNSGDDDDDNDITFNSDSVLVTITMPTLEEFEVMGAVDAELRDIEADDFAFELKGAGSVDISGSCGSLNLEIKGAGEVDAEDFECKDVVVAVKGVGEADVFASESVDADVSGIGSITVYGEPKDVRQSDNWLGKIRIK